MQKVHEIRLDCDNDVVLLKVDAARATASRHRLPHRPPQLLLPALRERRTGSAVEPVLKDPERDLQMTAPMNDAPPTATTRLARLAAVIEAARAAATRTKSYVARLLHKGPTPS